MSTPNDDPCCGHTKIKEVRWSNEQHSTSSKFMCLDCNTDFVPLTPEVRRFMYQQEAKRQDIESMPRPMRPRPELLCILAACSQRHDHEGPHDTLLAGTDDSR